MAQLWLTVDPGTDYTGVAWWNAGADWPRAVLPVGTALLRPETPRSADWYDRALAQAEAFRRQLEELTAHTIVETAIEWPEVWGSAKGGAAAKKGSTPKLCFLVGALTMVAHDFGIPFRPVTVREWKGQLSKQQVIRRIRTAFGSRHCPFTRDEWDAVGIGLFLKGHF